MINWLVMNRRNMLKTALLASPAALLADTPPADRPTAAVSDRLTAVLTVVAGRVVHRYIGAP